MAPFTVARRLGVAALVALVVLDDAHADEADGRISSDGRAAVFHYQEARTRVVAPMVELGLEGPRGATGRLHYGADVITSASVSVDAISSASIPAGSDGQTTFREVRNEGEVAVSVPVARGATRLVVGTDGRVSVEPDYRSYAGALVLTLETDGRQTVGALRVGYARDELWEAIHDADAPGVVLRYERPDPESGFDSLQVNLGLERVISSRLVVGTGFELGYLRGYLGNPYRRVSVDGRIGLETLPRHRVRSTLVGRFALAVPSIRSALHGELRLYADDWSMLAGTVEVRGYATLHRRVALRVRARGYGQRGVSFAPRNDVVTPTYYGEPRYTTANPRYGTFGSFEGGLALLVLVGSADRPARGRAPVELELGADYRYAGNRYGDAFASHLVLRVPVR